LDTSFEPGFSNRSSRWRAKTAAFLGTGVVLLSLVPPTFAREKDSTPYGEGLIINVPFSEQDVTRVVQDVVQNGIIRGTKEYNKDEYVKGAIAVSSTKAFPEWNDGGKVFYKIREHAIDPQNFKNTNDAGTLAVRYVVQPQGDKNTVLRINAVFVEDSRRTSHPSNGSVEGAEYKDIHDHLDAFKLMQSQAADSEREHQQQIARQFNAQTAAQPAPPVETPAPPTHPIETPQQISTNAREVVAPAPVEQNPPQSLEDHVKDLRRQVERLIKAPGAPLKAAPFHSASTLQSLPAGTEVLVVITTPYWLGVETHNGQHGWVLRDDMELLP